MYYVFLAIAEAVVCLYDICTDCNGGQNNEKKSGSVVVIIACVCMIST